MDSAEHWMAWPLACLSKSSPVPESACWWALEFSPRVALLEDALLMETSMVQRLWGGREVLLTRLDSAFARACQAAVSGPPETGGGDAAVQPLRGQGGTAWQALARLRQQQGRPCGSIPVSLTMPETSLHADALPLWTLSALEQNSAVLLRLGCRARVLLQQETLPRLEQVRSSGSKPRIAAVSLDVPTPGKPCGRPGCCPSPRPCLCRAIVPNGTGRCSSRPGPTGWSPAGGMRLPMRLPMPRSARRPAWPYVTISWPITPWSDMSGFTASASVANT